MSELKQIPIEFLIKGRYQPRRVFDEQGLNELAASLKQNGMVQPIVVKALGGEQYEIIAGERRWRAAQRAQFDKVPCLVRDYNDEQMIAVATVENINRVDLNPIEIARGYAKMIETFGYTHDEIAAIVGQSREKISNCLRLLKLDDKVQCFISDGKLTEGHGKVLSSLDSKQQYCLAMTAIREKWSVHQLSKQLKKKPSIQKSHLKATEITHFEQQLAELLGTTVECESNGEGGWLKLKYYDLNTLMGLAERLGLTVEE